MNSGMIMNIVAIGLPVAIIIFIVIVSKRTKKDDSKSNV